MQTRDLFIESDDVDLDEALEAAVEERKFLLKRLLQEHGHYSDDNEDSSKE
jgi:hypothetical protein